MKLSKSITSNIKSSKGKQVIGLFFSNIIVLPISFVTSYILTKLLGDVAFGNYSFLNNIFSLAIVIVTFGFFQAASRAIVISKDNSLTSEYLGASLIYLVITSLIMCFGLFVYGMYDTNIKEKHLLGVFLYLIPFGFVFLYSRYFEILLQADNRIKELSITRVYPKVGFLIVCLFLFFLPFSVKDKLKFILFAYIITQLIVYLYITFKIKVSFKNLKKRIWEIWEFNKTFGLHVYIGSLFSLGVAQLTGVLIGYFSTDNSGVGFYTLALSFASPLMMIPNTFATTHYKEFITLQMIPKKLTLYTLLLTMIVCIGLIIIMPTLIIKIYGSNFQPVIPLLFIVSVGSLLYGMGDYYNRFLGANGKGKELRNSAFIVGIAFLFLNYLLVPKWKAFGAAFAYSGGGFVYFSCMFIYYLRYVNFLRENAKNEVNG